MQYVFAVSLLWTCGEQIAMSIRAFKDVIKILLTAFAKNNNLIITSTFQLLLMKNNIYQRTSSFVHSAAYTTGSIASCYTKRSKSSTVQISIVSYSL